MSKVFEIRHGRFVRLVWYSTCAILAINAYLTRAPVWLAATVGALGFPTVAKTVYMFAYPEQALDERMQFWRSGKQPEPPETMSELRRERRVGLLETAIIAGLLLFVVFV